MQGACMSTDSLQFDKMVPRCLPPYQAENRISGTCKVMSLAQGHLNFHWRYERETVSNG